jgi:hypothetical protein
MALQGAAADLVVNASIMIVLGTEGRSHDLTPESDHQRPYRSPGGR